MHSPLLDPGDSKPVLQLLIQIAARKNIKTINLVRDRYSPDYSVSNVIEHS